MLGLFKLGCLFVVLFAVTSEAQFFTKSSKSIPRMGRRSDASMGPSILSRRALIDTLVDEIGPSNLLSVLESKTEGSLLGGSNEVAATNEQPIDLNPSIQMLDQQPVYDVSGLVFPVQYESLSRDERSPYLFRRAQEGGGTSLAMRALNTERYLRHLASGQPIQPLSRLVSGAAGAGGQQKQEGREQRSVSDRRK